MAKILRGDIFWADLNPVIGSGQGGFRPVLISLPGIPFLTHQQEECEIW